MRRDSMGTCTDDTSVCVCCAGAMQAAEAASLDWLAASQPVVVAGVFGQWIECLWISKKFTTVGCKLTSKRNK